jgi:hypothetical protein
MPLTSNRREFLQLAGLGGGVAFASALGFTGAGAAAAEPQDFFFVQLSDTHWGFAGPPNPEAATTLKRAVEAVNALPQQPDFVVFTGDLTHTTEDPKERRRRLAEFRDIAGALKVRTVRFMPGEHDAALDRGAAYREFFGETHYTFDHRGIHFIALDNVTDPGARMGEDQLTWLARDLERLAPDQPIVVLAHRPLFDLYPDWDWATADGARAIALLQGHRNVVVFYGHIHQEHHHMTGHIAHHAAQSLIFALPAPGSVPKRGPIAWSADAPFRGLGFRAIETAAKGDGVAYQLAEHPVVRG